MQSSHVAWAVKLMAVQKLATDQRLADSEDKAVTSAKSHSQAEDC